MRVNPIAPPQQHRAPASCAPSCYREEGEEKEEEEQEEGEEEEQEEGEEEEEQEE